MRWSTLEMGALKPALGPVLTPLAKATLLEMPGMGTSDPLLKGVHDLYANGEEGALYYFTEDFAGLYQDAAGTTPVTAVGQPVGLMLDRRLGLVRGEEMIPSLDLTSGWVAAAGGTGQFCNVTGPATFEGTGSAGRVTARDLLQVGKWYEVVVSCTGEGSVVLGLFNGTAGSTGAILTADGGTLSGAARFYASSDALAFRIQTAGNSSDFSVEIHSVSVREIPGNHASQPTTTARPMLSARKNLARYSEAQAGSFGSIGNAVSTTVNAPFGETTGIRKLDGGTSYSYATLDGTAEGDITVSYYVRRLDGEPLKFGAPNTATSGQNDCVIAGGGAIGPADMTVQPMGGGWYRVSATRLGYVSGTLGFLSYSPTAELEVTGLQIERGLVATRYQRTNTTADYDTAGFPHYLAFDGVDDCLTVSSIQLPLPWERVSAFRQNSWRLGANIYRQVGGNGGLVYQNGTAPNVSASSGAVVPAGNLPIGAIGVLSERHNSTASRVALAGFSPVGPVNMGTLDSVGMNIGSQNAGSSNSANVDFYGIVVRNGLLGDTERQASEQFVASRAGITLPTGVPA